MLAACLPAQSFLSCSKMICELFGFSSFRAATAFQNFLSSRSRLSCSVFSKSGFACLLNECHSMFCRCCLQGDVVFPLKDFLQQDSWLLFRHPLVVGVLQSSRAYSSFWLIEEWTLEHCSGLLGWRPWFRCSSSAFVVDLLREMINQFWKKFPRPFCSSIWGMCWFSVVYTEGPGWSWWVCWRSLHADSVVFWMLSLRGYC